MSKCKIEPSCYWCAELISAGHFSDLWECILYFIGKHIHIANPKIIIYLDKRICIFSNIIQQGHFTSELQLRNNLTIRKLFAEITNVLPPGYIFEDFNRYYYTRSIELIARYLRSFK
jgi:hypothetical protein